MTAYGGPPPNTPASPGTPGYYTPRPQISFDVINEAVNLLKLQMGAWVGATFLCGIVFVACYMLAVGGYVAMIFSSGAARAGDTSGPAMLVMLPFQLAIGIGFNILIMLLLGGLVRMGLKQVRGETVSVGDLFSVTDVLLPLIGTAVLVSIISTVGSMMCIIPGMIAYGVLMFSIPLVVDQRLGPIEAISQSFNMLKKDWLMATLFYFLVSIIGSIGFMLCGLGALFTAPIAVLSIVLTYRNYMAGGTPSTIPGTYPPTVPSSYMPSTGVAPIQESNMPTQSGYTPNTPQSGYTPNVPTTGYISPTSAAPYTPTPGYANGETPAPSYGNPTAPQYAPPPMNANMPTRSDNNYPTQTSETPEEPKP